MGWLKGPDIQLVRRQKWEHDGRLPAAMFFRLLAWVIIGVLDDGKPSADGTSCHVREPWSSIQSDLPTVLALTTARATKNITK